MQQLLMSSASSVGMESMFIRIEEEEKEGEGEGGREEGQGLWGAGGVEKKQRMMEMA